MEDDKFDDPILHTQKTEPLIGAPEEVDLEHNTNILNTASFNIPGHSRVADGVDLGEEGGRETAAFSVAQDPDAQRFAQSARAHSYTEVGAGVIGLKTSEQFIRKQTAADKLLKINQSDSFMSTVLSPGSGARRPSPGGGLAWSPAGSMRNQARTDSVASLFAAPPKPAFHKENKGPVGMPAVGKTLVFPREDNIYKGK